MLYTSIEIGGKEYKCRLAAKNCVDLEKRMGTNPINVFAEIADGNKYPNLEDMILIFHASLQSFNHNITLEGAYDLYDAYVDEGHNLLDLIPFLLEVFKISGFFQENAMKDEVEAPNAYKVVK